MNIQMKISLGLVIVLAVAVIYYIRKVIQYKSDERGQAILAHASTWVPISVTVIFLVAIIVQYYFNIADYSAWFNVVMTSFLTATYGGQALGIFYYERKI